MAALPQRHRLLPDWELAAMVVAVAAFAIVSALSRVGPRARRAANVISVSLVGILTTMFVGALASVILQVYERGVRVRGISALSTLAALWAANVVVFAIWYWMVDRGGPDRRAGGAPGPPDLLFPQYSAGETFGARWTPRFVDYLFVAFVTSTAFSPADTLPMTRRAKLLMMMQAVLSMATLVVLVGRAINVLE